MSTTKSGPQGAGGQPHNSQRSLIKSTSILSLGTLSSRILGFFRDILFAQLIGTRMMADAFFVALRIPNLFRDLVGEGATNSAIVPMLSEYKEKKSPEEFWEFVNVILILGGICLSIITLIGFWAAPVIVRLIAPGFMADPVKLELTISLTRLMFPYLIFIGLTAYSFGILYTFRSFKVPAYTPCLLNVSLIISALVSGAYLKIPIYGLACGVLIGGMMQLFVQCPALKKIGFRFKKPKTLKHEGAKRIGKLLVPRMFGSGVYQLTVLIDTFCASLGTIVGPGGISAIYYSNRIIHLPMGIFGVALASAVLPTMSEHAANKDHVKLKETIIFSLESIFFVMCPTTIMILVLAEPTIRILFQRGAFDQYSTDITSWALTFYGLGLFAFGGIKILVTAFHSLQDTKTPVKVAALCLVINAVLNFVLMFPLKIGGIALASALSGTIDFLILFTLIDRRLGGIKTALKSYILRTTLAAAISGFMVHVLWQFWSAPPELFRFVATGCFGILLYLYVCRLLKIDQAERVLDWICKLAKGAR